MGRYRPRSRSRHRQPEGEYAPPALNDFRQGDRYVPSMPNAFNQFGTQFGTQVVPSSSFSPFYTQPPPQRQDHSAYPTFPQNGGQTPPYGAFNRAVPSGPPLPANRPAQQSSNRARGRERYQTPRQRRAQRNQELAAEQRRASFPTWPWPEERALPSPTDSATPGPFASTKPLQRDNGFRGPIDNNQLPSSTQPLPHNSLPQQIPGLAIPAPPTAAPVAANTSNGSRPAPSPTAEARDAISPPSAESGGIPEPTAAYLMRAFCPPLLLPAPQPLLVVIDLNGTLLHRPNKRSPTKFIERPLARAFLRHCIDTYHVVIWSSARPENVQRMCAQLLPPAYLARVVAVWGRDRFGLTPADYARRTQCYKRLTRLWADPAVRAAHPQSGATGWPAGPRCWDQGNTVLIDDSAEKARSEPHNAVTLPEFAGDLAAEQQLQPWEEELEGEDSQQVLARVAKYLGVLAWQVDVSAYIRARPFTMGPGKGNISGPGA